MDSPAPKPSVASRHMQTYSSLSRMTKEALLDSAYLAASSVAIQASSLVFSNLLSVPCAQLSSLHELLMLFFPLGVFSSSLYPVNISALSSSFLGATPDPKSHIFPKLHWVCLLWARTYLCLCVHVCVCIMHIAVTELTTLLKIFCLVLMYPHSLAS